MRWSERPPVVRSRFPSLQPFRFGPRTLSVAVAHLVLVRSMRRVLLLLILATAPAFAERNEAWPADAPYNKVFEPHRACMEAKDLAKRGQSDALRTCFLAAYVRLNQPFLGGEDFHIMNSVFDEVLEAVGDRAFSRALEKQRPEIQSAVGWFMASFPRLRKCPRTARLFRDAPKIDWPLDKAYRNDR